MFGLTSAHAAGAIAIVMVGHGIEVAPGQYLLDDEVLNGVVIMILITCIISSLLTEYSARHIRLFENDNTREKLLRADYEKILIPVEPVTTPSNTIMPSGFGFSIYEEKIVPVNVMRLFGYPIVTDINEYWRISIP